MRRVEADGLPVQMEEAAPPPYSAQDAGTQSLPLQLSLRCDDVRLANIDPCSSAASYFEDRPCSLPLPSDILEHRLVIPTGATREQLHFPYPEEQYRHRDITDMDWSTFQNFLLPNWIAPDSGKANSRRSNKKLSAETQDETFRRARVEVVVAEWNDCFFGPRGVHIHYDFQSTPIPTQTPPPPFVSVLDIEPIPSASPTTVHPSASRVLSVDGGKQKEKHQDFWSRLEKNRHHMASRRDRHSDCHGHRNHRRWGRGRRSSSTSSSSSSSSSDSEDSGKGRHFHHHHGGHRWKSHRGRGRSRGRAHHHYHHHSHRSASTSPSSFQSSDTAVEPPTSPDLNRSINVLQRDSQRKALRLAIGSLKDEIHHHRPHRELKDQLRAQKKLIKADVKALIREGKAAHRDGKARQQSESMDLSLGLPLGLARRVTGVKI
ncbi:MAG: hypothetical protein LQ351_004770 [Letrouitia transgressa]|nr:MAG: hypothetical protein LQ351_004770 [Letrouitia transgressa]